MSTTTRLFYLRSSAAIGNRRHWRIIQFDYSDIVSIALVLWVVGQKGTGMRNLRASERRAREFLAF
jgi:hypothetical protein